MNEYELEAAKIRELASVTKRPGRQHERTPIHIRLLESVAYGLTDCWHWIGKTNGLGYGRMSYKGKSSVAHRLSYEAFVGKIPTGLFVLHKCDNRLCINPDHLFLGTYSDNRIDCLKKGRWALKNVRRGIDSPCSKMTKELLDRATDLRGEGKSYAKIGDEIGVSTMTAWKALTRRTS